MTKLRRFAMSRLATVSCEMRRSTRVLTKLRDIIIVRDNTRVFPRPVSARNHCLPYIARDIVYSLFSFRRGMYTWNGNYFLSNVPPVREIFRHEWFPLNSLHKAPKMRRFFIFCLDIRIQPFNKWPHGDILWNLLYSKHISIPELSDPD